jgi:hypothetical protein
MNCDGGDSTTTSAEPPPPHPVRIAALKAMTLDALDVIFMISLLHYLALQHFRNRGGSTMEMKE